MDVKKPSSTTHSPKTLDTLSPGQRCVVSSISIKDRALHHKLVSMGIIVGTAIEVLSIAPLGDPMKIRALNYDLALRLSEAHHISVQSPEAM